MHLKERKERNKGFIVFPKKEIDDISYFLQNLGTKLEKEAF
jgi:hypothetical protein